MFSTEINKISSFCRRNRLYSFFLAFCAMLPFQFALNPKSGIDLAIIRVIIPLLFLSWLVISIKNNRTSSSFGRDKITYLISTFLIIATSSLVFSSNIFWSLRKLLFLFSIIPIYFIASSVLNTETRKKTAMTALIGGGTAIALIAILQFSAQFIFGINPVYNFLAKDVSPFFLGNSFSTAVLAYPSWLVNAGGTTYMRAIAVFPDPHMLSYYFGLLIPWAIILWRTSKKYSIFFLLSATLLIIADICTFTRGGYIALIAGALIVLPLVSKSAVKKIFAACIILVFLFTIAPHNPVASRLTSSFDVAEGSNVGRLSNWQQAELIILNHPFGVGIGMYSLAVDQKADYRQPIYAHDLYLDIAAELGIIAAIILIGILILTFKRFWNMSKKQPFFIAGVASITIFAVHSLVETPLYSVHILPLICIIIAMSVEMKNYGEI